MGLVGSSQNLELPMCDLFVFAGEVSGDLRGEEVLQELYKLNPHLEITGVAGPKMRAQGMNCFMPMENFQVMGFIDVFLALPKLISQFYAVGKEILRLNPKAVLFIDYPGFNLRMARYLRKKGYQGKLIHYVCPSVWAWGKKRIPLMAENLDLLLTILPFEKALFKHTALQVEYVGHPLMRRIENSIAQTLSLPRDRTIIALFPGSRQKELVRNLPTHLAIAKRLLKLDPSLLFTLSVSHPRFIPLIQSLIEKAGLDKEVKLIDAARAYDQMRSALFAIAKSGTITLELAILRIPTVVTYGISPLDLFIAKTLLRIRLPFYSLPNIIAGKEVFPELIGPALTENALFHCAKTFLTEEPKRTICQQGCDHVRSLLKEKAGAADAAAIIFNHLSK
jgi:lipid-A-disaccharide synthase